MNKFARNITIPLTAIAIACGTSRNQAPDTIAPAPTGGVPALEALADSTTIPPDTLPTDTIVYPVTEPVVLEPVVQAVPTVDPSTIPDPAAQIAAAQALPPVLAWNPKSAGRTRRTRPCSRDWRRRASCRAGSFAT